MVSVMTNIIIGIIYLIISFSITCLFYKYFGKYGLYIWLCVSVILANIQTIKIAEIFGIVTSLGNISYGSIFLTTDILSEKYGDKATKTGTVISFIIMIIFSLLMYLFLLYEPALIDNSQESFLQIFKVIPRIMIASILAYYVSQRIDSKIYLYLKNKYNNVIISNNVSTIISQVFDTLIFTSIGFMFTYSFSYILELMISMIIFKIIIGILDTPFMLLVMKVNNTEL
jgi:hypothetical protein